MFKYFYLVIIVIIFPFKGITQETELKIGQRYSPVYSQYWVNGLAINPAYAGSRECFSNSLFYRNQWMGFKGAPKTQTLSSHTPFKDEKNAAGVFLFHEKIGVTDYYDVYGNYAFRFNLGNGRLSLGLKAGASIFQGTYSKIIADPYGIADNSFLEDELGTFPNFGVGMYYYSKRYYFGLSVPQFVSYNIENSQKKMTVATENYDFLLTGGYLFKFSNEVKFKPSCLIRYRIEDNVYFDVDANFIIYDIIWIGGAYRYNEEFTVILEYQASEQIKAGVAYDFAAGKLSNEHTGSLELILRYEFKYKIRAVNPRYF